MKIIYLLLLLPFSLLGQITYAESSSAGANDGTSWANALELQAAFNAATAGDIIYFRGTFGGQVSNVEYTISANGTNGNPITVIGRKSDGSEIVNTNKFSSLISEADDRSTFEPSTDLPKDGSDIPYLEGFRYGARNPDTNAVSGVGTTGDYTGGGTGLTISGDYIVFKNILIEGYGYGLTKTGDYVDIENINLTQIGDYTDANSYDACNPDNTDPTGCPPAGGQYWGIGIIDQSTGGTVSNSAVFNAGAEGVRNRSQGGYHHHNIVFENNTVNSNDYHYLTTFANNSVVEDIEIYVSTAARVHGHGMVVKWDSQDNIIRRVKITNNRMEFQYQLITNNIIEDFELINTVSNEGIYFANGASFNTFRNGTVNGSGIGFENWFEDGDHGPTDNLVESVSFSNGPTAVSFEIFEAAYQDGTERNIIDRCSFTNFDYLTSQDRTNSETIIKNSVLNDITSFERPANATVYPLDLVLINNTYTSLGFTPVNCGGEFADCADLAGTGAVVRVYNYPTNPKKLRNFKRF